ncbi:MAG: hypothetical protein ACTSUB_09075 [Candidatus Thorarchaeota archaeon]
MTNEKLLYLLERQIEVEKKTLNMLSRAESEVSETAVRLAFMDLRLDSWKHQKFLEGMVEMINETPCDEWSAKVQRYVDRIKLKKTLDALIVEEKEMLSLAQKSIDEMNDPIGKFLLMHLRDDEQTHTENLDELSKLIMSSPLQSVKGVKGSDIECN